MATESVALRCPACGGTLAVECETTVLVPIREVDLYPDGSPGGLDYGWWVSEPTPGERQFEQDFIGDLGENTHADDGSDYIKCVDCHLITSRDELIEEEWTDEMWEKARREVDSSNLTHAAHDPIRRRLRVWFTAGTVYQYEGVPAWAFDNLLAAESKGSHFHQHVRNAYPHTKIA